MAELKITLDGGGDRDDGGDDRRPPGLGPRPAPGALPYDDDPVRLDLYADERARKQAERQEAADRKREERAEARNRASFDSLYAQNKVGDEYRPDVDYRGTALDLRRDAARDRAERADEAARDRDRRALAEREEQDRREAERRARFGFGLGLATGAAGAAGTAAVGLPRNQLLPGLNQAAAVAATALSSVGPPGQAAAAALQVGAAAVTAFARTVDGFVARGRELAAINPQLAGASAYADVTRFRADLREGEQLGPQLARLIENQVKVETTIRELLLPVKAFVLETLNDALEVGLDTLVAMLEGINQIPGVVGKLDATIARIKDVLEGGASGDLIDHWLRDLGRFEAPPAGPRPAPAVPVNILGGA